MKSDCIAAGFESCRFFYGAKTNSSCTVSSPILNLKLSTMFPTKSDLCSREMLSSAVDKFVFHAPFYWYGSFYYFFDLWITGCRPVELLRQENLTIEGNEMKIVTAKTNEVRTIPINLLSVHLVDAVREGYKAYEGLTYDQLMHEFYRLWPMPRIYTEDKEVGLYCFRYNRAYLLHNDGLTLPEITNFFAWQNPHRAGHYVSRPLYFKKQSEL